MNNNKTVSKRGRYRPRILEWGIYERRLEGFTCDEAMVALDIPHQSCSSEFTYLKRDGLIVPTREQRLTRTGSPATVYYVDEYKVGQQHLRMLTAEQRKIIDRAVQNRFDPRTRGRFDLLTATDIRIILDGACATGELAEQTLPGAP